MDDHPRFNVYPIPSGPILQLLHHNLRRVNDSRSHSLAFALLGTRLRCIQPITKLQHFIFAWENWEGGQRWIRFLLTVNLEFRMEEQPQQTRGYGWQYQTNLRERGMT